MESKYYFQDLYLKYDFNILEFYKIFSYQNINLNTFLYHYRDYQKKVFLVKMSI